MKKFLYLAIGLILFLTSAQSNAGVFDGRFYPVVAPKAPQVSSQAPKSIDSLVGHFDHKITTVFSDIDGTLLPLDKAGEKGLIPESVKLGAKKLKQANIPLILVTGRSSIEAQQIAKVLSPENTYVVAQQGAQIINPKGEFIYEDNISHKDSKKILKALSKFEKKQYKDLKVFVFLNGDLYMTKKVNLAYVWQKATVLKSFDELDKKNPNFTLNKIGIYDTNPEKLKQVQAYLKKSFPNYHIDISADCYCDISSGSATKGNAIKKLSEILHIDLRNAAVLGDAENDISMLKLIKSKGGMAIAVGNAMDSTKSNANYITAPVYNDGFYKAVNKILENNSTLH